MNFRELQKQTRPDYMKTGEARCPVQFRTGGSIMGFVEASV